jgi:GT2 family glycosyltransferase
MALVSVIIVNYNTFTLTSNSLRSVLEYTHDISHEIILVDNASTERDPQDFLADFPDILLIQSSINGGFAYGNNLGIQKAKGDYVLLLNSDTILIEDTISKTVEFIIREKNVGVLGCRMIYPNRKIQYTARRFRSISWELLDLFRFILFLIPYSKRASRMLGKYYKHDKDIECDWVNGAFLLFPRRIIEQLPGKKLDERFFMYGEDQLWCEQIKNLGYKIFFYAQSTIIHVGSASTSLSKHLSLRKMMMVNELAIMQLRRGKGLYYYVFKMVFVSKETARNLIKLFIYRLTGKMIA